MFTHKAIEMRLEDPLTLGCPDWVNPAAGSVIPVPYISNYAFVNQYPFAAPVPHPTGFNVCAVVQYTPGLNVATTGCPLVGGDAGPGSGFGYFWDALLSSCAGPMTVDWVHSLYGNGQIPDVRPKITLSNKKYQTDSDTTAMTPGAGFRFTIHLQNNSGSMWGPGNLSLWMRCLNENYQGFAGTGLDLLAALSAGAITNPMSLVVPPISLGGTVNFTGNMGTLFEYGFSMYTMEAILSGGTPFVYATDTEDAQFCPMGCQDDNIAETYYYVQSPQMWGDGQCKRFTRDITPSGAFVVTAVDWAPGDFGGAGAPLYKCEIRTEGSFGPGTPDLSPFGLLGTFDRASVPPGTLYRAAAYSAPGGAPGILFPGPLGAGENIYARCLFDPTYTLIAIGASTGGPTHKSFHDSTYSLGTNSPGPPNGPDGEALPFNSFTAQLIMRLVCVSPADGEFQGNGKLASAVPTIASIK